jgi:hypothetical protein
MASTRIIDDDDDDDKSRLELKIFGW